MALCGLLLPLWGCQSSKESEQVTEEIEEIQEEEVEAPKEVVEEEPVDTLPTQAEVIKLIKKVNSARYISEIPLSREFRLITEQAFAAPGGIWDGGIIGYQLSANLLYGGEEQPVDMKVAIISEQYDPSKKVAMYSYDATPKWYGEDVYSEESKYPGKIRLICEDGKWVIDDLTPIEMDYWHKDKMNKWIAEANRNIASGNMQKEVREWKDQGYFSEEEANECLRVIKAYQKTYILR